VYRLARNISLKKVKQLNCFTFWFNERKCYSFCCKLKCHPIKNEKHKWLEITNADWLYFRHFETFAFLRFAFCDLRFAICVLSDVNKSFVRVLSILYLFKFRCSRNKKKTLKLWNQYHIDVLLVLQSMSTYYDAWKQFLPDLSFFKHAPKSVERQSDFCLHKCSASSFNVYFRDSAIFISGETKVQNFSFRLHFQCRNNTTVEGTV